MHPSLDTSPRNPSAVVEQISDRPHERGDGERLVQKEPSKTELHPIVVDNLRAVRGHQEDLYLRAKGLHFRCEL